MIHLRDCIKTMENQDIVHPVTVRMRFFLDGTPLKISINFRIPLQGTYQSAVLRSKSKAWRQSGIEN